MKNLCVSLAYKFCRNLRNPTLVTQFSQTVYRNTEINAYPLKAERTNQERTRPWLPFDQNPATDRSHPPWNYNKIIIQKYWVRFSDCDNNDDVDDDMLPEDKVDIDHDDALQLGEGDVEKGGDKEEVVAVPGILFFKGEDDLFQGHPKPSTIPPVW